MVRRGLGIEGFDVRVAADGVQALAVLEEFPADVVVLDVMMPGLDGIEVCRRLKADPDTAHIPVVMVTALDDTADRVRGLEAGADECESGPGGHELSCAIEVFHTVRDALEAQFGPAERAEITWKPTVSVEVDEEKAVTILKLIEALDDNDDVQIVSANFEVSDDVLEKLSA